MTLPTWGKACSILFETELDVGRGHLSRVIGPEYYAGDTGVGFADNALRGEPHGADVPQDNPSHRAGADPDRLDHASWL